MLAKVLMAEADAFVAQWEDLKLPDGRDRVVRHGHGPQRAIQTGIGPLRFDMPRCATGLTWMRIRNSRYLDFLPANFRRASSISSGRTATRSRTLLI
jgi:hypothetical protein